MVLINGNKYACETCIKGHRSSTCRHTDRALFEIKKKGRPVTQCEHCRELRKTKQVHVKCICEAKDDPHAVPFTSDSNINININSNSNSGAGGGGGGGGGVKKGHTKIPQSAAFPHGLPEGLGASVALQVSPTEAVSSDSEHGGPWPSACTCKTGGDCHCCFPRKSASKKRKKGLEPSTHQPMAAVDVADPYVPIQSSQIAQPSSKTPSHILARLAELRPVLPRPSVAASRTVVNVNAGATASHDPSTGLPHGHSGRHDHVLFSPYGRAYDLSHDQPYGASHPDAEPETPASSRNQNQDLRSAFAATTTTTAAVPNQQLLPSDEHVFQALEAAMARGYPMDALPPPYPSSCGCGDTCNCPGCIHHVGALAIPPAAAYSACTNTSVCNTCLDCTLMSLPSSLQLPPDTALSIPDDGANAYQADSIDEWLRQISANSNSNTGTQMSDTSYAQQQQQAWSGYLPPIAEPVPGLNYPYQVQECCGVLCKCPPESCPCDLEDENGYDCRRDMPAALLAALSNDGNENNNPPPPPPPPSIDQRPDRNAANRSVSPYRGGVYTEASSTSVQASATAAAVAAYLVGPGEASRSRSSSASSLSRPTHHQQMRHHFPVAAFYSNERLPSTTTAEYPLLSNNNSVGALLAPQRNGHHAHGHAHSRGPFGANVGSFSLPDLALSMNMPLGLPHARDGDLPMPPLTGTSKSRSNDDESSMSGSHSPSRRSVLSASPTWSARDGVGLVARTAANGSGSGGEMSSYAVSNPDSDGYASTDDWHSRWAS